MYVYWKCYFLILAGECAASRRKMKRCFSLNWGNDRHASWSLHTSSVANAFVGGFEKAGRA
jgi:hypothetical protein